MPTKPPRLRPVRWMAIAAALLAAAPLRASEPARYAIKGDSCAISARVSVMGLDSRTARFPRATGALAIEPTRPDAIMLDVTIDAAALTANDADTVERLKGASFFDVARHPAIRFASRAMRMTGPLTADIAGELTVRGVTRPQTLRVNFSRPPARPAAGGALRLSGAMEIDRRDYGMTDYALIVGNHVTITIAAELLPG